MPDQLKAGGMGHPSEAGKPGDFANSLAEAIEDAFNTILNGEGKPTFDVNDNSRATRDRRMLFVAIAQGVVNHLYAHQAAWEIWDGGTQTSAAIEIQVDPTPIEPT